MSKITSISTEVPAHKHEQAALCNFAEPFFSSDEAERRKLKYLYSHGGINTRYSVMPDYSVEAADRLFFPPSDDLEPFPSLEKRMEWYSEHAAPLSAKAIEKCINGKIKKDEITHLITVSCTGVSAPGLDLEIMELMELPRHVFRSSVNFMGCYAAIHGLKQADAICRSDEKAKVIVVCTELCTLHFQKERSPDNITSTLLFADGCAAVLVQPQSCEAKGISLNGFFSDVAFKGKSDMSWKLSSTGFLMTLSSYVPDLLKEDFDELLQRALQQVSVNKQEITHWCIHPGGKKILEAIEKSIALDPKDLRYSYEVLRDYGNMSSPTILFVLQKIFAELQASHESTHSNIFAAAFGPGLTMETFIASYD